jgi:hypothetical protein
MSPFDHLLIEVCAASPGPTATRRHVRPVSAEIMHFSTQAAADELNRLAARRQLVASHGKCRCFARAIVSAYDDGGFISPA